MRDFFLLRLNRRKHVLTGDFCAQNDHDQNQADRQIEVLVLTPKQERQTRKNADDQGDASTVPMMLPFPLCSACRRARQL